MSAVIPFVRPTARSDSWSQQEIAEFYRVEAALVRAGIGIASEHGVSDEGEPWFVFCRPDGDTIMHFARIDGSYLIASEVLDHPVRGADFRALIDQIAQLYPHLLPIPAAATGTKLVVHPAALLAALVAAAALMLSSEDVHAAEFDAGLDHVPSPPPSDGGAAAHDQPQPARSKGSAGPDDPANGRKQVEAIILSTMIFAAEALASDHADAKSDLDHLLADLASGSAHRVVHGDPTAGTSSGGDAASGAAAMVQPAVLAAQGSGEGQGTASTGGRIEPAPASRADFSGDRGVSSGRDAEHHAPSSGNEVGLTRITAETRAVGTSDQQTPATGQAEGASAASAGSGADGGDPRAPSSLPSTLDTGAQPRLAETAVAEAGSATGAQAWIHAAGQADARQTPAVSVSRDGDERGGDKGHGPRSDAADGPKDERPDEGRGRGGNQEPQAQLAAQKETGSGSHGSGDDDRGSAAWKAAPASGDGAQAAGPGDVGHETGPAGQNDQRGAAARDSHPAKSDPGPAALAGNADTRSGPDPDARSGHAAAPPTAHDQGPDKPAGGPEPGRGHEPSPGREPSPGHEPAAHAAGGPADAASPSARSPHAAADDADAHSAPPVNASAPPRAADHADPKPMASPHAERPTAHGQGSDGVDHGSPVHKGGEPPEAQAHSNQTAPASSAAQTGPARHEASQPDQTHPEHGTPSPAHGQDAMSHPSPGGPAASHGGSSSPTEAGDVQVAAADPGTHQASLDKPMRTEGQPPSKSDQAPQTATAPPHGQADPAQTGRDHPSGHAEPNAGPPTAPRAAIDHNGNLVFHGETHSSAPPQTAAHGADDPAAHPTVNLVGIADHGHVVHDPYHHG